MIMATRSTIAVKVDTDHYIQVYCHWDGYPEHNGRLLVENYNDFAKAIALVSQSNISSLRENLYPTEGGIHTFDNPEDNVTVFYGRDRHEKDCWPKEFISESDWLDHRMGEEYDYIFQEGEWWVSDHNQELKKVVDLLGQTRDNVSTV
jgi:hypothetical protein